MTRATSESDLFKQLTRGDVQSWAGSRILSRGQGYQRSHRVKDLARTETGALIAWVHGGARYATLVDFEDGDLISSCTCPYGATCKHAVAVLLEYLDQLKKNTPVQQMTKEDERLLLLNGVLNEEGWEDEDDAEELDADDSPPRRHPKSTSDALKAFLEEQTREQLISLLEDLAGKYSMVREGLQDRVDLSKGSVKKLVTAVKKEIRVLSSEPGWKNHWNDEGHIPDYSRVKDRLESLLKKGHADEVVSIGKELFDAGVRQVEMSHDEGETGTEISSCLEVIFRALPLSSLSPVEQMLWVIDAELEDEYELTYGAEYFWKKKQKASDWGAVADKLLERLGQLQPAKGEDGFSRNYRRDRLSNGIIRALENGGRHDEIIPLCEEEAVKTASYQRLVDALREDKRLEEAEQWIHRGIKATQKQWPGIASHLRDTLREMREKKGNWLEAAAFLVDDFLQSPALHTFKEMKRGAERAKTWPAVRAAALVFLETGKLPQTDPSWPLPEAGLKEPREIRKNQFPMTDVLIDVAIDEKRPDDVLLWYDRQKSKKQAYWGWDTHHEEENVAEAVQGQYPDRALAIWKDLAERQIALTKPRAYEMAAVYLQKARHLLKRLKKEDEWKSYLSRLSQANARKTKCVEILDRLDGRRIIEGK
jgi:uncharacterized Zn finger protein